MSGKALDEISSNLQELQFTKIFQKSFLDLEIGIFGIFSSGEIKTTKIMKTSELKIPKIPVFKSKKLNEASPLPKKLLHIRRDLVESFSQHLESIRLES